jgi:hypothetical protein
VETSSQQEDEVGEEELLSNYSILEKEFTRQSPNGMTSTVKHTFSGTASLQKRYIGSSSGDLNSQRIDLQEEEKLPYIPNSQKNKKRAEILRARRQEASETKKDSPEREEEAPLSSEEFEEAIDFFRPTTPQMMTQTKLQGTMSISASETYREPKELTTEGIQAFASK